MNTETERDAAAYNDALRAGGGVFTAEGRTRFALWYSQNWRTVRADHGVVIDGWQSIAHPPNKTVLAAYVISELGQTDLDVVEKAARHTPFPSDPNAAPAQRHAVVDPACRNSR